MRNQMPFKYTVSILCSKWNDATCPYKLRTEHEHRRNRQWAKAIERKMAKLGIREGQHYSQLSNGSLWSN